MKNTGKITLSAIMAALSAAFMLTSLFPYLTYAIPAIAGLFIMITVVEVGIKWGIASFAVSAVLTLLLPGDIEAKMLYVAFFGYYPILKSLLDTRCNRVLEYLIKFAVFNVAIVVSYSFVAAFIGVDMSDMNEFGKYTAYILLAAANIVFPIYDIAVTRIYGFYRIRLHKHISKIVNKK